MTFESARLGSEHDLSQFDCGVDSLNQWLTSQAHRAGAAGYARTTVWTEPDSPVVRAYYALSPTRVLRTEVGAQAAGGYSDVPAFLLGRLALDRTLHRQGYGSGLLLDALETVVLAANRSGGRLIVVDAIDDNAAAFYRRHDFTPIKDQPRRLYMKVSTARAAIGVESFVVVSDPDLPLASATLTRADSSQRQMVVGPEDVLRVAHELEDVAKRGQPVDIAQVILRALGRADG